MAASTGFHILGIHVLVEEPSTAWVGEPGELNMQAITTIGLNIAKLLRDVYYLVARVDHLGCA